MSAPTHPVVLAISRNDTRALQAATASTPSWSEDVVDGYTVWTRILVDKKRSHLLPIVLAAGLDPNRPVIFKGHAQAPLALCAKHGRHRAALQLLDAGASANVWVNKPEVSALSATLQQWNAARTRKPADPGAAPALAVLDKLVVRMLSSTPVVPSAVLDDDLMAPLTWINKPEGTHRELLLKTITAAWEKGVRPDAGPSVGDLRHVITTLRLVLHDDIECAHGWLRDVLASTRPTALWAMPFLSEVRNFTPMAHVQRALRAVEDQWSIQDRPWTANEINRWSHGWVINSNNSSLIETQLQVRLELLRWGLENGLPRRALLEGTRPLLSEMFSSKSLAAVGKPDFFMEVFDLVFRNGLSLSTPVPQAQGSKPWGEVLGSTPSATGIQGNRQFAADFWKSHRSQIEGLQARVCAEGLDRTCDQPISSLPSANRRF